MSAKTQKKWRELCNELHNEQDLDQLMDDIHELNGALERRVTEMTTLSEGPKTSPPRFNPMTKLEPIRIEKRRLYHCN
jgi:hypothetical protein